MNNFVLNILRTVEVGKGQVLIRLVPLTVVVIIIAAVYNTKVYHGLNDSQSMDNAQVARQIVRGQGFTTEFIRPMALTQLHDYAVSQSLTTGASTDLFPASQFPSGALRILPDTYNAPGFPYLLAGLFYVAKPNFNPTPDELATHHMYPADRLIPPLNQIFLILTAILVFIMGKRLFDDRVAWMSLVAFLGTDLFWQFTATGLSTSFLTLLITAVMLCAAEIFFVGEAAFESDEHSFGMAWFWALLLALVLAAACLTRLPLLILLVPLLITLVLMPRANPLVFILIALVVGGLVTPWFWHIYKVTGSPWGSNAPLLLYGEGDYNGNQIFCSTSIPSYEQMFHDASKKEYIGFRWHFEHAWNLLGASPMVLLFVASLLHQFKRRRVQALQWLLVGSGIGIVLMNNLGVDNPETLSAWNAVALLAPSMIVIGSAFFFILLDRLNLQLWLVSNLIVIITLILGAVPLALTLTSTNSQFYAFPPYMPPVIKLVGQLAKPDEWVTSDMPWATSWYGDRASLWLPDSVANFNTIHDSICPSGILLFTPVTWMQPTATLTAGEDKDWFPFVSGVNLPANFPLHVNVKTPEGGPEYSIWSDRPRWQGL